MPEFFIPASASLQERRPRILKHGDTFGVFDHNGDVIAGRGSPEGIYHRDTRHLSHFYLTVAGRRPLLLSSTLRDDNALLVCDLSNPDLFEGDSLAVEHDVFHIRRSRFLWKATCFERLSVRNFDDEPQRISLVLLFGADFADLFEVRGSRREKRGILHPPEVGESQVTLAYTGLDDRRRVTTLRFDPEPREISGQHAAFEFDIPAKETRTIFIEVSCNAEARNGSATRRVFFSALGEARRALRRARSRAATISTSNQVFNEVARRALADLHMLTTDTAGGPYPYAGIPWFSTAFGRDAIITAMQTLWLDPAFARGVLRHLAANQADTTDAAADCEPGKILHELRYGEMAELGEVPFRRYYGSVDSTPLFIMLAGAYLGRTGDVATIRGLLPNLEAALEWIEKYGDRDGDGFVEYGRMSAHGLVNQGWKDSYDAVFHDDGTLAQGPVALVEVQAYVYAAWRVAADIFRAVGMPDRASRLDAAAEQLRKRFDECFFDEDLGTYVLALDGAKRACRVRTSNAGHALFAGIALPHRVPRVVRTLMDSASFSGWGIRTVATTEARYNPMSYHNGSVWPHDNALIAAGFTRYGFRAEAARMFEGLFQAATYIDLRRLPELFCGFPKRRGRGPTFYPVACSPQAWAAATPLSLLRICLGMRFDPEAGHLTFREPVLPDFLEEVTLRGVTLPQGKVDVALKRAGTEVLAQLLAREGKLRVMTMS
jgi:glycogen debranching enzyme